MGVYVEITGPTGPLSGDSKHAEHQGWIVCKSCTIPTTRPETQTTMGKVTDRTRTHLDFEDIQLKKSMDTASPGIMNWNILGDGRRVKIRFTNAKHWYLELDLENAILTKLDIDADEEGTAEETLNLDFTKITYQYRTMDEKGKPQAAAAMNYDIALGN